MPQLGTSHDLPGRYLTPSDVAQLLGIPVDTLYQWRTKRSGPPAFSVGRHLWYDPAKVAAWVDDQSARD